MFKRIEKIIEYGLYLLVFLLPIQTRWIIKAGELGEYGTISLYAVDVLLIGLLLLFIIYKFYLRKLQVTSYKLRVYWYLIAGLDLVIFISIFMAQDKLVAIYKYAVFLLGVGLFWLIVSASYNRIKLIYSLLAGIVLQAGLGIWQFLTQSDFACKWLGMAVHNAGDLGTSVIETISSLDGVAERWLRAYGGLDHPNVLGGLLVVGLLLLIGLFITNSKYQITNNKQTPNNKPQITNPAISPAIAGSNGAGKFHPAMLCGIKFQNYLLLTSYFLLLTSLFFTFSRGAWLGLIIGVIVMLVITVIKKDLLQQKRLLEIILISGIIIFILFSQYQDLVMTRFSADARLEVKSSVERIESYKDAQELIKNHWLLGVGIGNYTMAMQKEIISDQPSWYYQPVHNVFLLVWAEIGIVGLLFFISLLLFAICYLLFTKNVLRSSNLVFNISLIAALTVMFTIDHWWWSLHFGVLLFWLVLGLMVRKLEFMD